MPMTSLGIFVQCAGIFVLVYTIRRFTKYIINKSIRKHQILSRKSISRKPINTENLEYVSINLTKTHNLFEFDHCASHEWSDHVRYYYGSFVRDHYSSWPRKIEALIWHDALIDKVNMRIIAISRNTSPQKRDEICKHLPAVIANLIMDYNLRRLRR